jgi:hypothetical protein
MVTFMMMLKSAIISIVYMRNWISDDYFFVCFCISLHKEFRRCLDDCFVSGSEISAYILSTSNWDVRVGMSIINLSVLVG